MAPIPHESIDGESTMHESSRSDPSPRAPSDTIKKTIHSLYTLQSSTHGYIGSETANALSIEIRTLSNLLGQLDSQAQARAIANRGSSNTEELLPPEIIEYVDAARNPDIYTREFVELVQRGNSYLKGKGEALASLRDKLATEMLKEWPEMKDEIVRVVPQADELAEKQ